MKTTIMLSLMVIVFCQSCNRHEDVEPVTASQIMSNPDQDDQLLTSDQADAFTLSSAFNDRSTTHATDQYAAMLRDNPSMKALTAAYPLLERLALATFAGIGLPALVYWNSDDQCPGSPACSRPPTADGCAGWIHINRNSLSQQTDEYDEHTEPSLLWAVFLFESNNVYNWFAFSIADYRAVVDGSVTIHQWGRSVYEAELISARHTAELFEEILRSSNSTNEYTKAGLRLITDNLSAIESQTNDFHISSPPTTPFDVNITNEWSISITKHRTIYNALRANIATLIENDQRARALEACTNLILDGSIDKSIYGVHIANSLQLSELCETIRGVTTKSIATGRIVRCLIK